MKFKLFNKKTIYILFIIFLANFLLGTAIAKTPEKEYLNELKEKILEEKTPTCIPYCVSIPDGSITNNKNTIELNLSINAVDDIVFQLPLFTAENSNYIRLNSITNNNIKIKNIIKQNNVFFVKLNKGINNLNIQFNINQNLDKIFLSSPIAIHYLKNNLKDFKIVANGESNQYFQITRNKENIANQKNNITNKITTETYFTINRFINFGVNWETTTIITKNNNITENSIIEIPLLNKENIILHDGVIENNKLKLSFLPNETSKTIKSILPIQDKITLKYTNDPVNYNEIWNLNIDYIWSFDLKGLKAIANQNSTLTFLPTTGDKLDINLYQAKSIDGNTLTFNNVYYKFTPSRNIQELNLRLQTQSTQSTFHSITLPENSKVQNLEVNYIKNPIVLKGNELILQIPQGISIINFTITREEKITKILKFPKINLNAPVVNINQELNISTNRFILFLKGSLLSPSVLFWSQALFLLTLSLILGKFKTLPLNTATWFILLIGIAQANILYTLIIVATFIILSLKSHLQRKIKNINYYLLFFCLLSIISLFIGIHNGLLGTWNMKIVGNNSNLLTLNNEKFWQLFWYLDITSGELPQPTIISLPIFIYRFIMVAWSIFISFYFLKWTKWTIEIFKKND